MQGRMFRARGPPGTAPSIPVEEVVTRAGVNVQPRSGHPGQTAWTHEIPDLVEWTRGVSTTRSEVAVVTWMIVDRTSVKATGMKIVRMCPTVSRIVERTDATTTMIVGMLAIGTCVA